MRTAQCEELQSSHTDHSACPGPFRSTDAILLLDKRRSRIICTGRQLRHSARTSSTSFDHRAILIFRSYWNSAGLPWHMLAHVITSSRSCRCCDPVDPQKLSNPRSPAHTDGTSGHNQRPRAALAGSRRDCTRESSHRQSLNTCQRRSCRKPRSRGSPECQIIRSEVCQIVRQATTHLQAASA